ncbi:MAG: CHRD domain-containing protein [Chloroflexota bacterium]|nr:CHRD domain-containing protein [Chloroflexota bacterium]
MKRTAMLVMLLAVFAAPGAVLAAERMEFTAVLTTEDEVPPPVVESEGSGRSLVVVFDDGSIEYDLEYRDMTGDPVAAHIHFGAVGEAGPVMLTLVAGPTPVAGTLTEADFMPVEGGPQTYEEGLDAIREGMTYVNVHTEANPAGEIRGQLILLPPTDASTSSSGTPIGIALLAVAAMALVLGFRRFAFRPIRP